MAMLRNLLRKTAVTNVHAEVDEAPPARTVPAAQHVDDRAERVHGFASEGRLSEALALADECLRATPDNAALMLAKGSTLFEWGRYHEAMPWFQRAEAAGADNFNLYLRAGWTCLWSAGAAPAERWMWKAADREPGEWTGHFGLATSLRGQGKLDDAIAAFERALEVSPGNLHCLAQLSDCMLTLRKPEGAEKYVRRAIASSPKTPVAWTNLGVALVAQDRFDEAAAAFEHADKLAEMSGTDGDSHLNLGMCLRDMGRLREALALYERRLPALPSVTVNTHYAHALLTAGRLAEGFRQYEFRWLHPPLLGLRPSFCKPVWAGQDLRGKTILLRTEQGIGDVVQFIRYAPHVKALGATVLLQVRPGLGELARSFPGIDAVPDQDKPYPPFDYYIHLMSLPRVFGTDIDSVPADVPYLHPDAARRERWAQRIGNGPGFRVALVWAGDANHLRDRYRSLPLAALAPLFDVEGVQFYALQKGAAAAQAATPAAGMRLIDLGPEIDDFADTAAVVDRMDLVISVDTSVAHLAGALGRPVWMLLATPGEWRWMVDREDTPWYPTMRLFRQRSHGDWDEVIVRVRDALGEAIRSNTVPARARHDARTPRGLTPLPLEMRRSAAPTAAAETGVGIVQYFPDQPIVGDSLAWYGEYLRTQTDLLMRLTAPGSVILEVGSGVGIHVLALAPGIGNAGRFLLYEGRNLYQQVLRQNLSANGVTSVTIMKRALKGQRGPSGEVGSADVGAMPVPEETIDELRLDVLHWLKVNEAADPLQILEGAADSLWRLRPKLFIAADGGGPAARIASRVRDFGYQCFRMDVRLFNSANFNRRDADIFGGRSAIGVLAIPEEIEIDVELVHCTRLQ